MGHTHTSGTPIGIAKTRLPSAQEKGWFRVEVGMWTSQGSRGQVVTMLQGPMFTFTTSVGGASEL
jgi:hypothetical protein